MEYPETVTEGFNRNYQALSFVPDLNNEYDVSYWKHLIQYALWYMAIINVQNRIIPSDDIDYTWNMAQTKIMLIP